MPATLDFDQPIEEMTVKELRAKAARIAGYPTPRARLSKRAWNSIYAHMTGQFAFTPAQLDRGNPPWEEVVQRALIPLINECYDHDWEDDEDGVTPPLVAYREHLFDAVDAGRTTRQMRRDELLDLVRTLDAHENQRTWAASPA